MTLLNIYNGPQSPTLANNTDTANHQTAGHNNDYLNHDTHSLYELGTTLLTTHPTLAGWIVAALVLISFRPIIAKLIDNHLRIQTIRAETENIHARTNQINSQIKLTQLKRHTRTPK